MKEEHWDLTIQPKKSLFTVDVKNIWRYRDLVLLFVRRDFVSIYKQTILGPLWFFIQPVFTTVIYTVIFGRLANISTDGIPQPVFYMSGIILWNYFSDCLMKTSDTFIVNQNIFGKVYFPRLVIPLSVVISNLLKLGVQVLLFIGLYLYYVGDGQAYPNRYLFIFPILILIMAGLGLSLGLIVSSLTTKYRDLKFLIQFGIQLAMYASPIVYPLSMLPEKYRPLLILNPVTGVIETFRYSLFNEGTLSFTALGYSAVSMLVLILFGLFIFNKVEKSFIDTV